MDELSPRALAKRQQITDAARALFLAQGYARTSMDAITAEAGVSKQTLYAYFDSKDDLLKAIVLDVQSAIPAPPALNAPHNRGELRTALIAFGERQDWHAPMLDTAETMALQVEQDWAAYAAAHDAGRFRVFAG